MTKSKTNYLNKLYLACGIFLISTASYALESDYDKPIHITSYHQHAKMKENIIVFTEDVILTQGSIKMTGDKVTVTRGKKPNHETMEAQGERATFYQLQDDGKPFNAKANTIFYDVAKDKIILTGDAEVKQLDRQINGTQITYFLTSEELIVDSGKTKSGKPKRVETVFLPTQK
jgi:lipopolysaccharide export system protein LptA